MKFVPSRNILAIALDRLRRVKLNRKILLIISFAIFVVIIFCFSMFGYAGRVRSNRDKEQNLHNYFIQSDEQLDNYLQQMDFFAYTIMFSSWVQDMIGYRKPSLVELLQEQENTLYFLRSLAIMNNGISMAIITDRERIYSDSIENYNAQYDIRSQPWFNDLLNNKKYVEYGSSELFSHIKDIWSITIYYTIVNVSNFDPIGFFAINISADKFDFLLSETQYDWITVTSSDGGIIINRPSFFFGGGMDLNQPEMIPAGSAEHKWIVYQGAIMGGHWNVSLFRRKTFVFAEEVENYSLFLIFLIPIFGFFIIITLLFSRYLTDPIVRCKNAMLEIRNNNFGITLKNHYHDEIGDLIDGFNDMSATLVTLRQKNTEIEKQRREAEISVLQQKVNPHFLYNTLEIINALIIDGQHDEAVQVCELLGQIYHYNLMSHKWVSLGDECEYIKLYLQILQHKMNSLSIVWEVDDTTVKTDMLKLILQPLVENAVLHGLRSRRADACLTIAIKPLGGKTEILIMDNGSGIPAHNLAEVRESLALVRRGTPPDSSHVGILNVYQRLYLEYGEDMEFTVESRLNYGTKVVIILPEKIAGKKGK